MRNALDVHRELLAAGVPHEMVRVRGGVQSADELPVGLGVDPDACAVVRCYVASYDDVPDAFVAVLLRAGDTPDPGRLLDALGATAVRPATADETNDATDYAAPLVCPVGLGGRVLLLADTALGGTDVLYAPTGEHGVALGIHTRDLLVAAGALATTLTARPLPPEGEVGVGVEAPGTRSRAWEPARRARSTSESVR